MIYLNAILAASFVGLFSWEENRFVHSGAAWQMVAAGLGLMAALYVLLMTVRPLYNRP
ncbi:hypothetical protein [Deinococcus hohokamensis]|uniref:Uncharacterized protein n=1 Tax=Deinococcus hohokamensis TaxID=309883 RepID=A0ABV9IC76_9DEIO